MKISFLIWCMFTFLNLKIIRKIYVKTINLMSYSMFKVVSVNINLNIAWEIQTQIITIKSIVITIKLNDIMIKYRRDLFFNRLYRCWNFDYQHILNFDQFHFVNEFVKYFHQFSRDDFNDTRRKTRPNLCNLQREFNHSRRCVK